MTKFIPNDLYTELQIRIEGVLRGESRKKALRMLDELNDTGKTTSPDGSTSFATEIIDDVMHFVTTFIDSDLVIHDSTDDGMAMSLAFAV